MRMNLDRKNQNKKKKKVTEVSYRQKPGLAVFVLGIHARDIDSTPPNLQSGRPTPDSDASYQFPTTICTEDSDWFAALLGKCKCDKKNANTQD